MLAIHSDPRFLLRVASTAGALCPTRPGPLPTSLRLRAFYGAEREKPSSCTADELHYVSPPNSSWRLALWRYTPSPQAPSRNHPLLLLSGVGTNAVGYDLAPEYSFARHMSRQGFDTWILEVRGAGLSTQGTVKQRADAAYNLINSDVFSQSATENKPDASTDESQMTDSPTEGTSGASQNPGLGSQITDLSQRLVGIFERGQRLIPPQIYEIQERLSAVADIFWNLPELNKIYDWDFDHYLEEDVPAAMEYIRAHSKSRALHAIGHSMGGILLYAMLARYGFEGRDTGLASAVTLASSLDYRPSKSSLKLLLPLASPAEALNVTIMPLGVLLTAAYPLASRPPYVLNWLSPHISARDMMQPELFERLVLNNFCTIPVKLLLQLKTVFQDGGLRDRSGSFNYKDHLKDLKVPVLAIAGDQDLICPPEAVKETIKFIPKDLVTYKVFGEPAGPHYAHYDLVTSRSASDQVYPCITEFLSRHDKV